MRVCPLGCHRREHCSATSTKRSSCLGGPRKYLGLGFGVLGFRVFEVFGVYGLGSRFFFFFVFFTACTLGCARVLGFGALGLRGPLPRRCSCRDTPARIFPSNRPKGFRGLGFRALGV